MKSATQRSQAAANQWVTFSLGDETYGIDVMQVQEVLRVSEIAPVPGALHYVLGIINLRGNVVTVVDARSLLGLDPREADDASRIVIIESTQRVVGMMVDSVAEVVEIRADEIESAPNLGSDDASRYVLGVKNREEGLLILVDLDKMLQEDDFG